MSREFTTREKILIVIFALLVIGLCYYKLLLVPINDSIEQYQIDTETEQSEIVQNEVTLKQMKNMQKELEEIKSSGDAKPMPQYDNSEAVLTELNTILSQASDYSLSFGTVEALEETPYVMQRPVTLTFNASSYEIARSIMDDLHDSDNVNQISDISIAFNTDNGVSVSLSISYFELTDATETAAETDGESNTTED